jgi:hypothetical protein
MGEMRVMGGRGDTKLMWDPNRPTEVENARKTFDEMKKKGYLAYSVKRKGEPGEVVRTFDPDAGKIILAPAMAGGARR